ncbi:viperin family antiviral radical SAM protein [Moritella sp. F3]|uniref:viperin family antiviral radical SAM protein n=1 Tax=Moritella sp. F3 TaxID=2718882 RepID=UPI0018E19994|nr:viperin family antiviral radical SAM protein [Moritella sp. F3]GIC75616.1 hypothetical protein FMO001_03430 [Moritella sp. F1]GIC80761.1 hypothetical protein FMO003_10420 [Moritella sp. F3]
MSTSNIKPSSLINDLVINWHITEACNYSCDYCFAKWGKPNELHRSLDAVEQLLDKLANYFIKGTPPLKSNLRYEHVRINFAGGEPMMLGSAFSTILMLAKQKGFKTSLITNGHYLLRNKTKLPNNSLDMIGISFDSQSYAVREKIGRVNRKGESLDSEGLRLILRDIKSNQRGVKTKINTVVNKHNWKENFSTIISELKPDKWKVLHVMPYGTNELLISDNQFDDFVKEHSSLGLPIYAESNTAMTESYLMIDPKGCFYQNGHDNAGYRYSEFINDIGVEKALSQINFNQETFIARYFPADTSMLVEA